MLLRTRQLAAVRRAIRRHLLVDSLLLILQLCGFTRSQLAAFHALRDAILLIFTALADLIVSVVRGIRVVLIVG